MRIPGHNRQKIGQESNLVTSSTPSRWESMVFRSSNENPISILTPTSIPKCSHRAGPALPANRAVRGNVPFAGRPVASACRHRSIRGILYRPFLQRGRSPSGDELPRPPVEKVGQPAIQDTHVPRVLCVIQPREALRSRTPSVSVERTCNLRANPSVPYSGRVNGRRWRCRQYPEMACPYRHAYAEGYRCARSAARRHRIVSPSNCLARDNG